MSLYLKCQEKVLELKIKNQNLLLKKVVEKKIPKKIPETKNTSKNIDEFNLFDNEIFKNLKSDAGGTSSGDIAMALTNTNNILINQDNTKQQSSPTINIGGDIVIRKSVSSYDTAINIAMLEILQTA